MKSLTYVVLLMFAFSLPAFAKGSAHPGSSPKSEVKDEAVQEAQEKSGEIDSVEAQAHVIESQANGIIEQNSAEAYGDAYGGTISQ